MTACRTPGMRSTGPCASVPECTAKNAAAAPRSKQVAAAGPVKGARPLREIHRKITPRMRSAIAKWTMTGWYAPIFGMGEKITAWAIGCGKWVHIPHPTSHDSWQLSRSYRIPNNVVYRKLDELRALIEPALRLGAHFTEAPLDILDLQEAQLVLEVKVCADHLLQLSTEGLALGFVRPPVRALQCARH